MINQLRLEWVFSIRLLLSLQVNLGSKSLGAFSRVREIRLLSYLGRLLSSPSGLTSAWEEVSGLEAVRPFLARLAASFFYPEQSNQHLQQKPKATMRTRNQSTI